MLFLLLYLRDLHGTQMFRRQLLPPDVLSYVSSKNILFYHGISLFTMKKKCATRLGEREKLCQCTMNANKRCLFKIKKALPVTIRSFLTPPARVAFQSPASCRLLPGGYVRWRRPPGAFSRHLPRAHSASILAHE